MKPLKHSRYFIDVCLFIAVFGVLVCLVGCGPHWGGDTVTEVVDDTLDAVDDALADAAEEYARTVIDPWLGYPGGPDTWFYSPITAEWEKKEP